MSSAFSAFFLSWEPHFPLPDVFKRRLFPRAFTDPLFSIHWSNLLPKPLLPSGFFPFLLSFFFFISWPTPYPLLFVGLSYCCFKGKLPLTVLVLFPQPSFTLPPWSSGDLYTSPHLLRCAKGLIFCLPFFKNSTSPFSLTHTFFRGLSNFCSHAHVI